MLFFFGGGGQSLLTGARWSRASPLPLGCPTWHTLIPSLEMEPEGGKTEWHGGPAAMYAETSSQCAKGLHKDP